MKLYFANKGNFDVTAMMTFGVSAKEQDDAIGYFGTGFKYAVAIILRLKGSIKVESDGKEYIFESRREEIRGKEFDVVYMNGNQAGFTTHLGANWQPWMAFREIYCNCTDEGGEVSESPLADDTVVTVKCELFYCAWQDKARYFVSGEPIERHEEVDIYDKSMPFIFYRGVAVSDVEDARFGYNLKCRVDLTEDRTLKYEYQSRYAIQKAIQSSKNAEILRGSIKNISGFEQITGFDIDWPVSDEFLQVCRELQSTDAGICSSARLLLKKIDQTKGNYPEYLLTKTQLTMIEKAKKFLLGMNVCIDDFPIKTVEGLGDGVMGMAKNGIIYLSPVPFQFGTKQVASTLLEEWVHNKTGAKDFDRKMQTWLFDKILSVGEEINGEPL